jgi:sigma-B regulation protein RsbU (phosphoserine phosphatase)
MNPIQLLLVDDNPVDAALAQQMLESLAKDLPVTTLWVSNAEQALGEVQHGQYDLMLLDYQMPGASGLDVLTAIHQLPANQQPAVIMLTASGSEKVAVEAMRRGARDYLRKDELDVAPLTRAIMTALSQKRLQDQVNRYIAQTRAELRMAHQLQHALLPQRFPVFPPGTEPAQSALRFEARYVSTTELGGDFYDVFPVGDRAAGVFICDVMGHGVRAALVTAMVRGLVEELRPAARDPGLFLTGINRGLFDILRTVEEPLFATAFYLVADAGRGELRYANAGHPAPLGFAGEVAPLPTEAGPALGLFADGAYRTTTQPAAHRVVLFTDGLFEVVGPHEEEFGQDRLLAAARRHAALPAAALLDQLLQEARQFSAAGEFADDVCLLAVEVHP